MIFHWQNTFYHLGSLLATHFHNLAKAHDQGNEKEEGTGREGG